MKPFVLCILDGVGIRHEEHGNALKLANTKTLDYLFRKYPHSLLEASGTNVGLPEGQMGNSEVGHLNIGAGRIVYQPLQFITKNIENETFFKNSNILDAINHCKENNSKIHICGLLSDGGVHSHINHLFALLDMCKKENVNQVFLHLFTDGRDTLPKCAVEFFEILNKKIKDINLGKIATITGRYYAMDRDNNYERTKKAYDAIVFGKADKFNNYEELLNYNYSKSISDEFINPGIITNNSTIDSGDSIIVFNYRPDRLRQLFMAITNEKFKFFETKKLNDIRLVTMMPVSKDVVSTNAYSLPILDNTLGEYIGKKGLKQLRIAETEKFAHVTYFFDGGEEKNIKNCDKLLIPSQKVSTYDIKPEMSAYEITTNLISRIENYDFVVLNYANGDMVGHTGNLNASIKALETLDNCLGKLYEKIKHLDGKLLIIADHGNCEYMLDNKNNIVTSHTTSPVPCILCDDKYILKNGLLCDIAPTVLSIMKIDVPKEMSGNVLTCER